MMKKVLKLLDEGSGNTDSLARDLDVGRGTIEAVLEMATREGYVEKTEICNGCSNCPLGDKCGRNISESNSVEIYTLTPKGGEHIETNWRS
ncbi:MAG: hypothetical protein ACOCSH_02850 [Candidatus Hadarchaeota archaeon]